MLKRITLPLAIVASFLMIAPAFAASPMHVKVKPHTTATFTHGAITYTITPTAHGYTVTQTVHGKTTPVKVSYHNPKAHNWIYVRSGCIVYIDYNDGVWTGYYYYVC